MEKKTLDMRIFGEFQGEIRGSGEESTNLIRVLRFDAAVRAQLRSPFRYFIRRRKADERVPWTVRRA